MAMLKLLPLCYPLSCRDGHW